MDDKPLNNGEITDRDKNGQFVEGNKAGQGRPKGTKNYLTLLEQALEAEAEKANKTYWQKLAEWCFTNPALAVAILKKFVPDKTQTEITGAEPIKFEVEVLNGNKETEGK